MFFEQQNNERHFNKRQIAACYRAINDAMRRALSADQPRGRSAALFNSPELGRAAYDRLVSGKHVADTAHFDAYFADVPRPYLFRELGDSELYQLVELFGLDIMRANFLSANLLSAHRHQPLFSGGACALETWATRLLGKPGLKKRPGLRRDILLKLLDDAPYYTHISGAMMLGAKTHPQIMYDETFPWFMAIHDIGKTAATGSRAWNPDNVRSVTRELYDRIYHAIGRRSHLISAEPSEILRVRFEDLKLDKDGHLERWYRQYMAELPRSFSRYVPHHYQHDGFIGAYVRYTYVGPDLLGLLKATLGEHSHDIARFTIHVRTKQDDHLYEGRRINRILLQGIHDDDHDFLSKYANICNLAIYFWHQQHWRSGNAFAGFSDLSFRGNIVHDTINLATGSNDDIRTDEGLWDIVSCPIRLNRNNIEDHFACLDKYCDDAYIYGDAALAANNIKGQLDKYQRKIDAAQAHALERDLLKNIIALLSLRGASCQASVFVGNDDISRCLGGRHPGHVEKELAKLSNRYRRKSRIAEIDDAARLFGLFRESLSFDYSQDGLSVHLSSVTPQMQTLLNALVDVIQGELTEYQAKIEREKQCLEDAHHDYVRALSLLQDIDTGGLDLSRTRPHLLPLRDNLVFCHAMQLTFDPNIALFLLDAEAVASSTVLTKTTKKKMLTSASRLILPRIKYYLRTIMSAYEPAGRYETLKIYSPVLLDDRCSAMAEA